MQAVSFLPGFPDGSIGWAKVRPHLPNAAEIACGSLEIVLGLTFHSGNGWSD